MQTIRELRLPESLFTDLLDAFDEMQRGFVRNGWSDGLPLVPPVAESAASTAASVAA